MKESHKNYILILVPLLAAIICYVFSYDTTTVTIKEAPAATQYVGKTGVLMKPDKENNFCILLNKESGNELVKISGMVSWKEIDNNSDYRHNKTIAVFIIVLFFLILVKLLQRKKNAEK